MSKFAKMRSIYNAVLTVLFILFLFFTVILVSIVKVQRKSASDKNSNASLPDISLGIEIIPEQDEAVAIEKFKHTFGPDLLYKDFMRDDAFLLGWIRDSKFDLRKAGTKLLKSLKWRIDNDIDIVAQENFADIRQYCPYSSDGRDKEGNIVVSVPFGKWRLRKSTILVNMTRLNRYIFHVLENIATTQRALQRERKDARVVGIVDFAGFSIRDLGCLKCLPLISNVITAYEENYPEYIKSWNIINVSRIGQALINMFMPLLSPKSRQVMKVFGDNQETWDSEIKQLISANEKLGFE